MIIGLFHRCLQYDMKLEDQRWTNFATKKRTLYNYCKEHQLTKPKRYVKRFFFQTQKISNPCKDIIIWEVWWIKLSHHITSCLTEAQIRKKIHANDEYLHHFKAIISVCNKIFEIDQSQLKLRLVYYYPVAQDAPIQAQHWGCGWTHPQPCGCKYSSSPHVLLGTCLDTAALALPTP